MSLASGTRLEKDASRLLFKDNSLPLYPDCKELAFLAAIKRYIV